MEYAKILSAELNVPEQYAAAAIALIDEGNTIPFIARYRKEATNAMDDQVLRTDVMGMEDLKPGMELTGTVRNVIDFGVFVDIGVHQDGLVHISQLREGRRVQHPSEVCAVGDIVTVWVLEVDEKKKRISITMKKPKGGAV